MNIEGTAKNIIGKIEDNAMLLTVLGAAYARAAEDGDPLTNTASGLIPQFTTFNTQAGVISELMADVGMKPGTAFPTTLIWKLWGSPHLYTMLIKVGLGVWAAGKLGVIPARFEKLGVNVAKGAAITALLMPGSGPNTQRTMQSTVQNSVSILGMQSTQNAFKNIYG
jgi:hypothetical protein